ncbi:MAG: glutaredoxin family protein [Bifidobacteriaceae bacterium]|jgi:glutaredoxin-like protein NrdH|nr:glutaredoxin family protein [Bifidobacteriaceae bacterium]
MVTLYSKPHCPQCEATKRLFDKFGVSYNVIDITKDQDAMEYIAAEGFMQAPVVIAGDEKWCGLRPDMIQKVAKVFA